VKRPVFGVPGAAPVEGHHSVSLCPAGRYGLAPMCHFCAKGQYNDKGNSPSCTQCAAGFFQSTRGMSHCDHCQKGKYGTKVGAIHEHECIKCPAKLRLSSRQKKKMHGFGRQEGSSHTLTALHHIPLASRC
jgi:hypothetical protein